MAVTRTTASAEGRFKILIRKYLSAVWDVYLQPTVGLNDIGNLHAIALHRLPGCRTNPKHWRGLLERWTNGGGVMELSNRKQRIRALNSPPIDCSKKNATGRS
jgi:hypothetical protein